MSAKPAKKSARPAGIEPAAAAPTSASVPASTAVAAEPATSWIDSTDPKKRLWGKIILVAVWIYVAALWLLALDQTFHWGIFGPKVPPVT